MGFPGGSAGKESSCNVEDLGLIPGLGRFPGEGNSYPLQYSGSDPMDCNLPGSSIHGIFQARVLEWGATAFSVCISEVIDISPSNLDSNCASSSPVFFMMYSAYKLNKQGDNLHVRDRFALQGGTGHFP